MASFARLLDPSFTTVTISPRLQASLARAPAAALFRPASRFIHSTPARSSSSSPPPRDTEKKATKGEQSQNILSVLRRLYQASTAHPRSSLTSIEEAIVAVQSDADQRDRAKPLKFTKPLRDRGKKLIAGIDFDFTLNRRHIGLLAGSSENLTIGTTVRSADAHSTLNKGCRLQPKFNPKASQPPLTIRNDPNWQSRTKTALERMKCHFEVVTTPTADSPGTAIVLHFDNKRYLFGNVSEGTQRSFVQSGVRMIKLSDLFLTGKTEWKNNGGLIGLILTFADVVKTSASAAAETMRKKKENLQKKGQSSNHVIDTSELTRMTIVGAPNLTHTLSTMRRFVFRRSMPIYPIEIRDRLRTVDDEAIQPTWSDSNIKVWAMALVPKEEEGETQRKSALVGLARKHHFDELMRLDLDATSPTLQQNREIIYDNIRKSVVADMFNSSWRLDALEEVALRDVQLPATVFVRDPKTKQTAPYTGPLPGGDQPLLDPDLKVLVRRPWPAALVAELPPTDPAEEAISYFVQTYPQRGRFLPKVAMGLGLKPGPILSELTRGNSVQNDKGETITPEMVMEPTIPGTTFAVIEIPSAGYISSLITRPEWTNKAVIINLKSIVWILGKGVIHDASLRRFMEQLGDVKHMISAPELSANRLTMDNAAAMAVRLSCLDPARYSAPVFSEEIPQIRSAGSPEIVLPTNAIIAERGLINDIQPIFRLQAPAKESFDVDTIAKEVDADAQALAHATWQRIEKPDEENIAWRESVPNPETEIVALGTGSALPSKYRNVSATLARVPGYGGYLFDSGENTLGQLRRVFGDEGTLQVLRELRMIWISHMHADHHLGTTSVIKAWRAATKDLPSRPSLAVVSDQAMLGWLAEYSQAEDFGYSFITPLAITSAYPSKSEPSTLTQISTQDGSRQLVPPASYSSVCHLLLGLADIQAVSVQHCLGAKGVSITFPDGLKISYSGDCRPSKAFAAIGQDTTVLIHEATFDDELSGDALAKKHCTTSEALEVGQAMKAKAVLLTHFSQRYQKIPVMEFSEADATDEDITALPELEDDEDLDEMRNADVEIEDGAQNDASNAAAELHEDTSIPINTVSAQQTPTESSKPTAPDRRSPSPIGFGVEARRIRIRNKDMKVAVAFDYMRLKVGDFWQMQHFTPALVKLLASQQEQERKIRTQEKIKANKEAKQKKPKGGNWGKEKIQGKGDQSGKRESDGDVEAEGAKEKKARLND